MISVLSTVTCDSSATLELLLIIKNVLQIICITVPIILIISCMISVIKTVTSSDSDLSKLWKSLLTKIIIAALVFYVPTIVNFVMDMVDGIKLNKSSCWNEATRENIKIKQAKEDAERKERDRKRQEELEKQKSKKGGNISYAKTFKLQNSNIFLGHYKKKINTYTIVITDNNGNTLNNNDFTFKSQNQAIAEVSSGGTITAKFGGTTTVTVTSKQNTGDSASINVNVIQSIYSNAKTKKALSLTNVKTGKKENIAKGTTGVLNGICRSGFCNTSYMHGDILKIGENYYYVSNKDVESKSYSIAPQYSDEVAEGFVNFNGFKSPNGYLFWSGHGSQVGYLFQGSQGNWKIYKTFDINSGDALGFYTKEHSSTGVHLGGFIMGSYDTGARSYPIIHKGNSGNVFHAFGDKSHIPKSHGCTRFTSKGFKELKNLNKTIKGCKIIEF